MTDTTAGKGQAFAELTERNGAELVSLLGQKREEMRKARFKHAMGQLRETHTLRRMRRDIARLKTAARHRDLQAGETP